MLFMEIIPFKKYDFADFMKTSGVVKMIHSNDFPRYIPLEHTPSRQPILYEGIPFIRGFGDAWDML